MFTWFLPVVSEINPLARLLYAHLGVPATFLLSNLIFFAVAFMLARFLHTHAEQVESISATWVILVATLISATIILSIYAIAHDVSVLFYLTRVI